MGMTPDLTPEEYVLQLEADRDRLTARVVELEEGIAELQDIEERLVKQRDAYKHAGEQAMGMGTGQAILDDRDRLKMQVRELEEERDVLRQKAESGGCLYAGPGRGDCEHFIGLPGLAVSGQHDGPDDTVDAYGKPNGWCWSCWKSYQPATTHCLFPDVQLVEEKK